MAQEALKPHILHLDSWVTSSTSPSLSFLPLATRSFDDLTVRLLRRLPVPRRRLVSEMHAFSDHCSSLSHRLIPLSLPLRFSVNQTRSRLTAACPHRSPAFALTASAIDISACSFDEFTIDLRDLPVAKFVLLPPRHL